MRVAVGGGGATADCGGFLLISDFLSRLVGCGRLALIVGRTARVLELRVCRPVKLGLTFSGCVRQALLDGLPGM